MCILCLAVFVGYMLFMAWAFDGRGLMPLVLRMCLRYWISLVKKWHLLSFINRCVFLNFSKNLSDVAKMLFCHSAADNDVIQIGYSAKEKSFKTPVISSCEIGWCLHESKGYFYVLIFSKW